MSGPVSSAVTVPELCVICYNGLSGWELKRRNGADPEQIGGTFSNDAIFTLKVLFQLPEHLFETFVGSCNKAPPGLWISLCDRCIQSVVEARPIYEKILKLVEKFKSAQKEVIDRLKGSYDGSFLESKGIRRRKKGHQADQEFLRKIMVTDECRKSVNERNFSGTTDEPFIVEDVTSFTQRLTSRLMVPEPEIIEIVEEDNEDIIFLSVNDPLVNLEPSVFSYDLTQDDNQDPLNFTEDDKDPLDISEHDRDPLNVVEAGCDNQSFKENGSSSELDQPATEAETDLEYKEDVEMKTENSDTDEMSVVSDDNDDDSEWDEDEMSNKSSSNEEAYKEDDEVKTISERLVLGGKKNECPTCHKQFQKVQGLKTHLWQIHKMKIVQEKPDKSWACPEVDCDLSFSDFKEYQHHLLYHKKGEPKHKCEACERAFFTLKGLRHHAKLVHDIIIPMNRARHIKCPECPTLYYSRRSLRHHMAVVHKSEYVPDPANCFKCTWEGCEKVLTSEEILRAHISRHEGKPIYKCDRCDSAFYSYDDRSDHRNLVHPGMPFLCDFCEQTFDKRNAWSQHRRRFHTHKKKNDSENKNERMSSVKKKKSGVEKVVEKQESSQRKNKEPVQCYLCGKQYVSQNKLSVHLKFIHEKDYQFRCDICGVGIRSQYQLKVHMVQCHNISSDDSGEIPQCSVVGCRRVFPDKKGLEAHIASEHGESGTEMRFQCSHCGKGFHSTWKFTQHEMTHTNQETRPFKCDICGKGFTNQHNMRYHQLNTHKVKRKVERKGKPRTRINKKTDVPSTTEQH